jgi:hypothetical protein
MDVSVNSDSAMTAMYQLLQSDRPARDTPLVLPGSLYQAAAPNVAKTAAASREPQLRNNHRSVARGMHMNIQPPRHGQASVPTLVHVEHRNSK